MWGLHGGSCSAGISVHLDVQGFGLGLYDPGFTGLSIIMAL